MPTGGLVNLYEKIRAGEADVVTSDEPEDDIDGEFVLMFGAQVGWSLRRELASVADVPCTECRDNPLPGKLLCMGCYRSGRDGEIATMRARP